jgi:transcriptional regulator with XRE-family HTH domain
MFYYENKIREIRNAKRLTQSEVALRAGVNSAFLSKVENYKHGATLAWFEKVAMALDVKVDEIIKLEKDPTHMESHIVNSVASEAQGADRISDNAASIDRENILSNSILFLPGLKPYQLQSVWEYFHYLILKSNRSEKEKESLIESKEMLEREEQLIRTASDFTRLTNSELCFLYSHMNYLIYMGEYREEKQKKSPGLPDFPF